MEIAHTVTVYHSKRPNVLEDLELHEHGSENFKISHSLRRINPVYGSMGNCKILIFS